MKLIPLIATALCLSGLILPIPCASIPNPSWAMVKIGPFVNASTLTKEYYIAWDIGEIHLQGENLYMEVEPNAPGGSFSGVSYAKLTNSTGSTITTSPIPAVEILAAGEATFAMADVASSLTLSTASVSGERHGSGDYELAQS